MAIEDPRALILRRRAVFVTSALAATGCQPNGKEPDVGTTAPTTPVVSVASSPKPAAPVPTVEPVDPPPKDPGRPGYDIPDGVSEEAKKRYERLHRFMKESHAKLDPVLSDLPDCTLAKCEPKYQVAATVLADLRKDLRLFYICPGQSDEAKAFQPHYKAHQKHLHDRLEKLDAELEKASGDADGYHALLKQIAMSKPVPCLSFACPDW
jgi:hypothetical protein